MSFLDYEVKNLEDGMESLYCNELLAQTGNEIIRDVKADVDPALKHDSVLTAMLENEKTTTPLNYYQMNGFQTDLHPYMRRIVANWMFAVCTEQKCEPHVFPVAINIFDRFLCTTEVNRNQLQLIGSVCMLLATKLRQSRQPFSIKLLAEYTDNSVTPQEIMQWEILIVTRLGWDLMPTIANDVLDHILYRTRPNSFSENSRIRQHSISLINAAVTDLECIALKPSLLALGAIGAAARGLHVKFPTDRMANLIDADPIFVEQAIALVEKIFEDTITENVVPDNTKHSSVHEACGVSKDYSQEYTDMHYDGNETPTDVPDISF